MNRTKKSDRPAISDDGALLTPVDGKSELGDLNVVPIEPPPFPSSRPRRRENGVSERDETTSTPEDRNDSPLVKDKPDTEPEKGISQKAQGGEPDEVVIGLFDNRVLVTPTTSFPASAICRLIVRFPWTPMNTAFAGTGALIGSRHVLTAGHVLFDPLQGGWAQTIRVVPGMDGNTWWFGSELLTWPNFKQRSVSGWTVNGDIDFDYGLITLNKGFSVGSFGLMYLSDSTLDSTTAYITGYPGELGSPQGTQQFGVPGGGAITDYDSTLVYYGIDTTAGQSGSGVYHFWNGKRAIIGVHGGGYDSDENRAARITQARYTQIRAWQKEDE